MVSFALGRYPRGLVARNEVPGWSGALATRYRNAGMSTKTLIKEIVMSRTYRLSNTAAPGTPPSIDLENRLLARANRRRISPSGVRQVIPRFV